MKKRENSLPLNNKGKLLTIRYVKIINKNGKSNANNNLKIMLPEPIQNTKAKLITNAIGRYQKKAKS